MSLKSCPFCNGEAELRVVSIHSTDPYYHPDDGHEVRCRRCGARSAKVTYMKFNRFSPYSVEDFKNNNALRAREEQRYELYVDGKKYETAQAWNERYEHARPLREGVSAAKSTIDERE